MAWLALAVVAFRPGAKTTVSELWNLDRLDNIGGHQTAVLGEPRVLRARRSHPGSS